MAKMVVSDYNKRATLSFLRPELLYDIRNLAFVESDVMPADDEHDRHQVADICEDGNVDRVTRVMDLAVAKCREMLYPYSKREVDDGEERNNTLREQVEYSIELLLPASFSKSTLDYLHKMLHEYIVYCVLFDWMSIANLRNSQSALNWHAKKLDLEDRIGRTLTARIRKVRRRLSPW